MATKGLANDAFARAMQGLARAKPADAATAARRADMLPDQTRRAGTEIQQDGVISQGELSSFAAMGRTVAQGLSAPEKRMAQAAGVLYQAMYETPAQTMRLMTSPPQVAWAKEVPISTLSGRLQVLQTSPPTGRPVLDTDLKAFAQRVAGPGQRTIGPDDFAKALQVFTPDEHYLAKELFNRLYFSKPLATIDTTGTTPGGRAAKLTSTITGSGDLPTGGYHPATSPVTYALHASHVLELTLHARESVVDLNSGQTWNPDRSHKVSIPLAGATELAIVTRGVRGQVKERLLIDEPRELSSGTVR